MNSITVILKPFSDVLIAVYPGLETDRLVQFEAELLVVLLAVVVVVAEEAEAREVGRVGEPSHQAGVHRVDVAGVPGGPPRHAAALRILLLLHHRHKTEKAD